MNQTFLIGYVSGFIIFIFIIVKLCEYFFEGKNKEVNKNG